MAELFLVTGGIGSFISWLEAQVNEISDRNMSQHGEWLRFLTDLSDHKSKAPHAGASQVIELWAGSNETSEEAIYKKQADPDDPASRNDYTIELRLEQLDSGHVKLTVLPGYMIENYGSRGHVYQDLLAQLQAQYQAAFGRRSENLAPTTPTIMPEPRLKEKPGRRPYKADDWAFHQVDVLGRSQAEVMDEWLKKRKEEGEFANLADPRGSLKNAIASRRKKRPSPGLGGNREDNSSR
jgi:hypothetical protein